MNKILILIFEFFKTGLFAVGGGLSTIPFLHEIGDKYNWYSIDELSTMIGISESTPGPMGVNMATYVGYNIHGFLGAIVATLSLVLPSLIIICIVANYFEKFKEAKIVKYIFNGIKPAVIAFIIAACSSLFISTLLNTNVDGLGFINYKAVVLLAVMYFVSNKYKKIHPIFFIIFASIAGIIFKL